MYLQNATGTQVIADNVIFNAARDGAQAYTEGGAIQGFTFEGNLFFNNGVLGYHQLDRNLLIGGFQPAGRITVRGNHLYHGSRSPGFSSKANVQLGYGVANDDALLEGNSIVGGNPPFYEIRGWSELTLRSNTVIGFSASSDVVNAFLGGGTSGFTWQDNDYWQGLFNGDTFSAWQTSTGLDGTSRYHAGLPTQNEIVVRPNRYAAGRGHVVVYNWEGRQSVDVDLSTVLACQSRYAVYDLQDLEGTPVAEGVWTGGLVTLPMNLTAVTQPKGTFPTVVPHTALEFGTFLVVARP